MTVALDELCHDTADRLDAERQRGDVEEEHVLSASRSLAREDASLDSSAVGDSLVRVDTLVGGLAVEVVLEEGLDLGDARGSSDEDDLVDLVLGRPAST